MRTCCITKEAPASECEGHQPEILNYHFFVFSDLSERNAPGENVARCAGAASPNGNEAGLNVGAI